MKSIVLVGPLIKNIHDKYRDSDIAAIDGGLHYLIDNNIDYVYAIGDFDSLNDINILNNDKVIKYNSIKNETDTQLAIEHAIKLGYDEIIVLGVLGGRLDHEIANISLLINKYDNITLVNENNCINVISEGITILEKIYKYFSIIPLSDGIISITNAKYELENKKISKDDIFMVSNEFVNKEVIISVKAGKYLLIQSED